MIQNKVNARGYFDLFYSPIKASHAVLPCFDYTLVFKCGCDDVVAMETHIQLVRFALWGPETFVLMPTQCVGLQLLPQPTFSPLRRLPRYVLARHVKHASVSVCTVITRFTDHRLHTPHVLLLKSTLINILLKNQGRGVSSASPGDKFYFFCLLRIWSVLAKTHYHCTR